MPQQCPDALGVTLGDQNALRQERVWLRKPSFSMFAMFEVKMQAY
jgi:hypothetical protein